MPLGKVLSCLDFTFYVPPTLFRYVFHFSCQNITNVFANNQLITKQEEGLEFLYLAVFTAKNISPALIVRDLLIKKKSTKNLFNVTAVCAEVLTRTQFSSQFPEKYLYHCYSFYSFLKLMELIKIEELLQLER